ncbi:testis-expressed protein 12 isoform X1 [Panthera uncia]|uniref:testis-expressed protein 12 isoform X1 n=2 Tax=Panthera uncia TaxID=29064 RepID=UPI0020FFD8D6|nr:testis-expressed protein 12 isoform X1 [Panthera uncia]
MRSYFPLPHQLTGHNFRMSIFEIAGQSHHMRALMRLTSNPCLQNMMASQVVKPDTRNCKRPRELEPQMPDSPHLSSLGKSDSSLSESSGLFYKDESLEKDLNDMSKEINLMLSAYAKILRQRAAVDASYIDEIDGLFKEANTIENFLVQKRELLRQRFTVIANTLHR